MNSPTNAEELYNLRHASARNVVEHIFGSLKKRFTILTVATHYDMDIQARIPPALAATHNFILKHDPLEADEISSQNSRDPAPGNLPVEREFGTLARGAPTVAEKARAKTKRDNIAQAMWVSYQDILAQRRTSDEALE